MGGIRKIEQLVDIWSEEDLSHYQKWIYHSSLQVLQASALSLKNVERILTSVHCDDKEKQVRWACGYCEWRLLDLSFQWDISKETKTERWRLQYDKKT